jgi:hypothetical protein
MAERRVRCTGKDKAHITSLGNKGESWSPIARPNAIAEIKAGTNSYYVEEAGYRTKVEVRGTPPNQFLETVADATHKNNLGKLPDC